MSWKTCIDHVTAQLPKFNTFILKDFRRQRINNCANYLAIVYQEALKLFNDPVEFLGYKILTPKERLEFIIGKNEKKLIYNIQRSELQLVEYMFRYMGETFSTHIYLPYSFQDSIVLNETKYFMQLAIVDRAIYKSHDSVVVNNMRSFLHFWRTVIVTCFTPEGLPVLNEILVTTKIHYKSTSNSTIVMTKRKRVHTPLALYLFCKYGFVGTLRELGIDEDSIRIVGPHEVQNDTDTYTYIKGNPNTYIKVRNNILTDIHQLLARRVIVSLVYILDYDKFLVKPEDIYDPDRFYFYTVLGLIIFGKDYKRDLAYTQAMTHMQSIESYLDEIAKIEFEKQGVVCNDIFDLLKIVFMNIDKWNKENTPNNLYYKKIGGEEILLFNIVKTIFNNVYSTLKTKKKITPQIMKNTLKLNYHAINKIYADEVMRNANDIFNDNKLFSFLSKKIRYSNSGKQNKKNQNLITHKSHQFHPSFAVVESILAFPSANPCIGGTINPFLPVYEDGTIFKPDYAKQLDGLEQYLPLR